MQDAINAFLIKSQPAGRVDFAKSVAGCMIGDVHYSVRKVGYKYNAAEVVTEVQLVRDAEIIARSLLTIGNDRVAPEVRHGIIGIYSTPTPNHNIWLDIQYLLRTLETILKPEVL